MREDLINLGFSNHEADIYLAMIEGGVTGAGAIIKATGLHRNIVYDTLDKLIAKKLVIRVFKKNVSLFQVTDPERIIQHEKSRLSLAETLVPELAKRALVKQDIVVYDGLEGFRTYSLNMLDNLQPGDTLYVIGSVGNSWYELMGDKYKAYERKRLKRRVAWKIIAYSESSRDEELIQAGKNIEVGIVTQPFNPQANMLVYGDRVSLQTLVEPYSVIEIQNRALANSYLNYFNTLWERSTIKT